METGQVIVRVCVCVCVRERGTVIIVEILSEKERPGPAMV